jgi:hypothetical protein
LICKELKIPINIDKSQALLWRLPLNHQKIPIVAQDLKKRKAGFNGESTVYYHLSFLNDKKYKIFHDVRLPLFSNILKLFPNRFPHPHPILCFTNRSKEYFRNSYH